MIDTAGLEKTADGKVSEGMYDILADALVALKKTLPIAEDVCACCVVHND